MQKGIESLHYTASLCSFVRTLEDKSKKKILKNIEYAQTFSARRILLFIVNLDLFSVLPNIANDGVRDCVASTRCNAQNQFV